MATPPRIARALGCLAPVLVLADCGGHASVQWHDLRSAAVTVSAPGLPPRYGAPKTTEFTTRAEVTRVQAALNANHISKQGQPSPNTGCGGGFDVTISITEQDGTTSKLFAYRCAHMTTGDMGGDVDGFLKSVGVRAP